ncbi:MAG: HD domain-containing protein [Candidatus Methanoperedens sp.]|nr:HD domain-containing protein [Candidatus Methanoperedens sp.]
MELRDAIYGDIILQDNETESKIIDTFEMQRLKLIKQLGFVNFVYPCANHTRFEHSLGTRWIAQKIVTLSELKPKDQKILYLAALIHDIAEPCFVHVTERLKKSGMMSHEEIIKIILDGSYKEKVIELKGKEFKNANFICDVLNDDELDEIKDVFLNPETDKLKELIDGYIDADNLDYLRRDAFYTGLPYGNYDDRIFSTFIQFKDDEGKERIGFRDSSDSLNAILSVLNSRFALRKAAYLHHTSIIADEMFLKALDLAHTNEKISDYDIFICGDLELLYKIRQQSEPAKVLIDMLLQRKLFKRAYVLDYKTPTKTKDYLNELRENRERANLVQRLSNASKINEDDILLGPPAPINWKDYDLIRILQSGCQPTSLDTKICNELHTLEHQYNTLWKFGVYLNTYSSKKANNDLKNLNASCFKEFNVKSKYKVKLNYEES